MISIVNFKFHSVDKTLLFFFIQVDAKAVEAMFDDIAEEDDPTIATMEGKQEALSSFDNHCHLLYFSSNTNLLLTHEKLISDFFSSYPVMYKGICAIAEKLNIDPLEDIRILVLLHKLGANAKPGQISREEWKKGCDKLQTDSIEKLQGLLPGLDTGFMMDHEFREFYKVCV